MQNIDVSVIVPVYNGEKCIKDCIDSVISQKDVSWECIIVDDNSSDNTADVISPYLQDDRFKYVLNEINKGVAYSRNYGVKIAGGKYIAFLDADDYWTDDKLKKQFELMERKSAVISSTGRELMDDKGNLSKVIIGIPEIITYNKLLKGNVINTSGTMVRRDVALKFPMTCDHLHEDYIMWLSILKEYDKAYGINEPLLKYRVVKGSKSANKIESAKMTYGVYRYMGFGRIRSAYYFMFYAVKGIIKYRFLRK